LNNDKNTTCDVLAIIGIFNKKVEKKNHSKKISYEKVKKITKGPTI